jgi:hypothetical protein
MNWFYKQPVRFYDNWHKCEEYIPWEFRLLKNISNGAYSSIDLVMRDDGMLWLMEEHEVSWMYNPENWWSRFEFVEIWSIEDLNEYVNERFPWWFKLIDYLNEEFDEKFPALDEENKEDNHFTYQMWLDEVHICSKKDWYVKWLYDKWYIDKEKILPLVTKAFAYVQWEGNFWSLLDDLYAYLAVCDEPLKDLASVLK